MIFNESTTQGGGSMMIHGNLASAVALRSSSGTVNNKKAPNNALMRARSSINP